MIILYRRSQQFEDYILVSNFYLSQLRIRIEMAFGHLTTKWRIFRRDFEYSTDKNSQIVRVGMKLHNYVINVNCLNLQEFNNEDYEGLEVELLIDRPRENCGFIPSRKRIGRTQDAIVELEGGRRYSIYCRMNEMDLQCPSHNIQRNG